MFIDWGISIDIWIVADALNDDVDLGIVKDGVIIVSGELIDNKDKSPYKLVKLLSDAGAGTLLEILGLADGLYILLSAMADFSYTTNADYAREIRLRQICGNTSIHIGENRYLW